MSARKRMEQEYQNHDKIETNHRTKGSSQDQKYTITKHCGQTCTAPHKTLKIKPLPRIAAVSKAHRTVSVALGKKIVEHYLMECRKRRSQRKEMGKAIRRGRGKGRVRIEKLLGGDKIHNEIFKIQEGWTHNTVESWTEEKNESKKQWG